MTLTVEQIDQIFQAWDERLARVAENLAALDEDSTYQLLSGGAGKRASLEGVTKEKVTPAIDGLLELYDHRERLRGILDRAKEIRQSIWTLSWGTDEKLAEITKLLKGPSINMGETATPLAQRTLLDAAVREVAVEPEALLSSMVKAYERAKKAVTEVQRAWAKLEPAIEQTEKEVGLLQAAAKDLSEAGSLKELTQVEAELHHLRARVARDPLGVAGNFNHDLGPKLATLRSHIEAQRVARDRAHAELARAQKLEQSLLAQHKQVLQELKDATKEVVVSGVEKPVDEATLDGMWPWLRKLEATARSGRWSAADVGLQRWLTAAEGYLADDKRVSERLRAVRGQRSELLGRLAARRAQVSALLARGLSLDPEALGKASEAEERLKDLPVDLALALGCVEVFEHAVVKLAAQGRKGNPGPGQGP